MRLKYLDSLRKPLWESVMVMALLILFGVSVFTLLQAGKQAEENISGNMDSQAGVRVAVSYINSRIRNNDSTGLVSVSLVSDTGENGIVLRHRSFDENYDRWIYYKGGAMLECITEPDIQPNDNDAVHIAEVNGFSVSYDEEENSITTDFEYLYNGKTEELGMKIKLRSAKMGGGELAL